MPRMARTKLNVPFLVTLPLAALMAGLIGAVLGLITLRVSGRYLSIVTLGFCEIAEVLNYKIAEYAKAVRVSFTMKACLKKNRSGWNRI